MGKYDEAKAHTKKVIDFIVDTKYEDIPAEAIENAKGRILDCIGVAYSGGVESCGKVIKDFPTTPTLKKCKPVFTTMKGWHCDIPAARKWEDLPQEARDYVEYLEKAIGCKITYISVGAEREAYIHHNV